MSFQFRKIKKILSGPLLSLASLIIMLVFLEVIFRIFIPPAPSIMIKNLNQDRYIDQLSFVPDEIKYIAHDFMLDTDSGNRLKRNIKGTLKHHYLSKKDVEISTNSLGFRNAELDEKESGAYRILALGDSITWGDYLPLNETYPFVIEEYLKDFSKMTPEINHIDVINAGVGGADLFNQLAVLIESGLKAQPDVVLIGLYLNDAYTSPYLKIYQLPPFLQKSYFLRYVYDRIGNLKKSYAYHQWKKSNSSIIAHEKEIFLSQNEILYTGKLNSEKEFNAFVYIDFSDWGYAWSEGFWDKIIPTMKIFKTLSAENNFKLAVVMLPVKYQVQSKFLADKPQRRFAQEMKKLNLPHLDLLPTLREKYMKDGIDLYYDHCHYQPEGNELIGKTIGQFLIDEVL